MPTQILSATATATITANGRSTVTGRFTWTAPTIPADGTVTAVRIMADTYTWGGRGSFTLTINGRTVSSGETVNVSIPVGTASPYSFTGRGGNIFATGANCQFTNLRVEYDVQLPSREQLLIKDGGAWRNVSAVYKKIGGVWVLQEELAGLFDTGANYVKGFS